LPKRDDDRSRHRLTRLHVQLSDGLKQHGSSVKVIHTLEVLARKILQEKSRKK
jgi:hypothetical protein